MPASLKFESVAGTAAATLGEVKIITLEDNTGNKYILDITTPNLKVAYATNRGNKTEYTVNGLATALGKLLTIDGSTPGKSVLAEEVAKTPVVDVLVPALATVGTDDTKKVYTKDTANTSFVKTDGSNATDPGVNAMLGKLTGANLVAKVDGSNATEAGVNAMLGKLTGANLVAKVDGSNATEAGVNAMLGKLTGANLVAKVDGSNATEAGVNAMLGKLTGHNQVAKIDASNLTNAANKKAFAEAILPAQDGKKSILVDKLEGFLGTSDKVYSNNTKTAKELLVPSAAEIAADPSFKVNVTDAKIKELVQEEMSQLKFDIPASDDVALDWTW